jgi:subtilisin-like proprotein convertase family protein
VSEIVVPEGAPALTDLSVTVHIRHSYRGDLSVTLERDGLQPIVLVNRQGSFRNDINETFQVPALQGQASSGTWRLRVKDHARGDAGTLTAWSLQWH